MADADLRNTANALMYAGDAALNYEKRAAIEWSGSTVKLPTELAKDETGTLILHLPKILKDHGFLVASKFMHSWLWGNDLKENKDIKFKKYKLFDSQEFSTNLTISRALEASLAAAENMVEQDAKSGYQDQRWNKLRKYVQDYNSEFSNEVEWTKVTDPFSASFHEPKWYFGRDAVTHFNYAENKELLSDGYGTLARFGINKYLRAQLSKKAIGTISLKPISVGIRIEDSYDFDDGSLIDALSGIVLSGQASQPLGVYRSKRDGKIIHLTNSDFENFKKGFAQKFNAIGPPAVLKCANYAVYSSIIEKKSAVQASDFAYNINVG